MKRLLMKSLTAVALVAGFVSCATAADVIWSGTTGSYTDATQWDGGAVPTAEDTAKIGSGATVSLTGSDEQNAKNVYFGYVENDSVAAQFLFSGLLRVNDTFLLGQTQGSAGAVEQTGGALTTVVGHDPSFSIGYQKDGGNGAVSTYKLSDGSITVTAGTGHVGSFGNGIFEMSGGTFTISSWFVLAWQAGSSGTMDLSGGTLTQTSAGQGLIIGEHGTASLTVRDNGVVENVGRLSMNGNSSITVKNGGRLTAAFLARQNNDGDNPVITLDGGTLAMTGTTKVRGDYFPAFTTTMIGTGGATLEIPKDYQATVAQPFGGSGGLTKTGQGTLTLTGDSTYTGPTRVREGALFLATPTTIPSLANLTLDAGTTLGVRSDAGWSMEAFTQTIIPKVLATPNANLGIDTTVQDVTYDMDLTFPNGGGLVKAGKNKLTLTGAIDYTGDTRIEGGVLAAADGAGLPTASHLTFAGGIWAPLATSTSRALGSGAGELSFTSGLEGGFSAIGAPLTVNLGGAAAALAYGSDLFDPSVLVLNPAGADNPLILANPIDISAKDLTINIDSTDAGAAVTLAGGVSGAHHLTKTGAGTVIFNGPLQLESHWLVLNGGNAEMKNSAITYGPMHDIRVNNGSKLTIDNVTVDMTAWLYAGLDGKNAEVIMESGTLNNAAGRLIVGQNANSSGTFTLNDGTVTTKHLIVGNKGTGEFIQNGGSVTDLSGDGDTVIGEYDNDNNVVGTGTYRMNGGTLTVNDNFQVGARGTGNLIQSAGDISSSGWFVVGRFAGGVGSYVMTGGTYTSTKNPAIIGESGVGTLDVSKTAVFKAPALRLGSNADGTGSVTVHDGGTLEVAQINKGPGVMDLAFDGGAIKVTGDGATISDFFQNLSNVAVGNGGLALDVGNNTVSLPDFAMVNKSAGTLTKTGTGNLKLASLPPFKEVAVNEGALLLAPSPARPTLAHRWSFNNSYTDSVTGTDATPIGSVTLTATDAQLLGGNKGTSYIDLGQNVMPSDSITIEIWSTLRSHRTWEKMFSFGSGTANGFLFTYSTGSAGNASSINAVANGSANVTGTGNFDDNVQYYLGITVTPDGNGGSMIKAYRKDVTTGETLGTIVNPVKNWTVKQVVQNDCWLGNTWWGDPNPSANYNEVRIWNGVFTEDEMTAHVLLGADALPPEEADEGNVYPAAASDELVANDYLLHRWSFNGNAFDQIGGAKATFVGKVTYLDGTSARLEGGGKGTSWIDLGQGVIPVDDTPFTIEMWTTVREHRNWAKAFSFGNGKAGRAEGETGIIFTYKTGNSAATSAVNMLGSGSGDATGTGNFEPNVEYHLTITVDPDGNGGSAVCAYVYEAATGRKLGEYKATFATWTPSKINLQDCWLGQTWWGDNNPSANYNEVRIWNAALSEAQVVINNRLGPNTLPALTGAATLQRADRLTVAEGASVDLSGYALEQPVVSGTGEIKNGTLTVTSKLLPGGEGTVGTLTLSSDTTVTGTVTLDVGDVIASAGVLDLTQATVTLADPTDLAGGYLFATSDAGGIVGPVAGSNLAGTGYGISISSDGKRASIIPFGTMILLR